MFFYLEPEIGYDVLLENVKKIKIIYNFFPCRKQKIAEIVHQQQIKELKQKDEIFKKRIQRFIEEQRAESEIQKVRELMKENQEYIESIK